MKTANLDHNSLESLRELDDGGSFVSNILELYIKSSQHFIKNTQLALVSADARKIAAEAHSFKTGSKIVGALEMVKLCQNLEDLGISQNIEQMVPLLKQITEKLNPLIKEIQELPEMNSYKKVS